MRAGTEGMKYIDDMMVHYEKKHALHIELYGEDNHKRLTGIHIGQRHRRKWRRAKACDFNNPDTIQRALHHDLPFMLLPGQFCAPRAGLQGQPHVHLPQSVENIATSVGCWLATAGLCR